MTSSTCLRMPCLETTLFAELFIGSTSLELVEENPAKDGQSVQLTVRVLDKRRWDKLMVELLLSQYDSDDSFGVSIRKEYYIEESDAGEHKVPKFGWVILFWGDMEDVTEVFGPLVQKKTGPPPPPASVSTVVSASKAKTLRKTISFNDKNEKMIRVVAPLPHRAAFRNARSRTDKGKGATAELMGYSESSRPAVEEA